MNAPPDVGAPGLAVGTSGRAQREEAADDQSVAKKIATLRALMALHGGHELVELDDGSFVVSMRNLSRRCATIVEVEQFAKRIGVPGL